jgi:hypothetical protein
MQRLDGIASASEVHFPLRASDIASMAPPLACAIKDAGSGFKAAGFEQMACAVARLRNDKGARCRKLRCIARILLRLTQSTGRCCPMPFFMLQRALLQGVLQRFAVLAAAVYGFNGAAWARKNAREYLQVVFSIVIRLSYLRVGRGVQGSKPVRYFMFLSFSSVILHLRGAAGSCQV